jgi:hypothetical protein
LSSSLVAPLSNVCAVPREYIKAFVPTFADMQVDTGSGNARPIFETGIVVSTDLQDEVSMPDEDFRRDECYEGGGFAFRRDECLFDDEDDEHDETDEHVKYSQVDTKAHEEERREKEANEKAATHDVDFFAKPRADGIQGRFIKVSLAALRNAYFAEKSGRDSSRKPMKQLKEEKASPFSNIGNLNWSTATTVVVL